MNDENFDKIVREKIKKNVDMPEKINQLFLEFEKEVVNMEVLFGFTFTSFILYSPLISIHASGLLFSISI